MNDYEHGPSALFLLRDQYEESVKAKHNEITKNYFSFEPVINTELRINKNQISQVSWDIWFDRLKNISGNKIKINSWKHDSFLLWPNWDVFPFLFCTSLCCYSQLLRQKRRLQRLSKKIKHWKSRLTFCRRKFWKRRLPPRELLTLAIKETLISNIETVRSLQFLSDDEDLTACISDILVPRLGTA